MARISLVVICLATAAIAGVESCVPQPCTTTTTVSYMHSYIVNILGHCCGAGGCQLCTMPMVRYTMSYGLETRCCPGYEGTPPLCYPTCSPGLCTGVHEVCCMNNTCACEPGWTGPNCLQDVSECTTSHNCEQLCYDTHGSYYCGCRSGFELARDGYRCLGGVKNMASDPDTFAISLSWSAPEGNILDGNFSGYRVSCVGPTDDAQAGNFTSQLSATISDLEPYTNYTCCVTSMWNLNGNGFPVCQYIRTGETVPGGPPSNINTSSSYTSVLIRWSPPLKPNGQIIRYLLYIDYTNGREAETLTVSGMTSSYTLGGLKPHQSLVVRISAVTSAGEGPLSSEIQGIAGEASPVAIIAGSVAGAVAVVISLVLCAALVCGVWYKRKKHPKGLSPSRTAANTGQIQYQINRSYDPIRLMNSSTSLGGRNVRNPLSNTGEAGYIENEYDYLQPPPLPPRAFDKDEDTTAGTVDDYFLAEEPEDMEDTGYSILPLN